MRDDDRINAIRAREPARWLQHHPLVCGGNHWAYLTTFHTAIAGTISETYANRTEQCACGAQRTLARLFGALPVTLVSEWAP
jgi:hypothetical protein